jgi:hypothetical protein
MSMTDIEKRACNGGVSLPILAELPVRVSRDTAAELLKQLYFEISPRTLERWPLAWRILNGKAHCETADLFAMAEARVAEAPVIMGGAAPKAGHSPVNARLASLTGVRD